jgi:GNAT superfamily N-acetyltransferase
MTSPGIPEVRFVPLAQDQLAAATRLAAEFLGRSGTDALLADFAAHPGLVIAATVDGPVAGVAFGRPDGTGGATLDGITVDDAHTARGLGSLLLGRFEQAAANAGLASVSLGSGPGYVEHFYLKNGYRQTEYMVVIPGRPDRTDLDLEGLEVLRERRREPDELVLNIAAPGGYSPVVGAALQQRLHASEACCIFSKPVARPPSRERDGSSQL